MLTRTGRWFLAFAVAAVVAGRLLGSLEVFVVGVGLAALVLLAVVVTTLTRLRLSVDRELHPPRVHAGTPSRVELRVENQGSRRSPVLELRDAVSGTRGARLLVGPLEPGQWARSAYRLPTERRGVLAIGPLEVLLSDPFGLTEVRMQASGVSELTVYPHVDDVAPVPQTTGNDPLAGAEHPNALGRSGEDFYALRPYVVGDDLRRVHWASTARHDELMVRQDELPWQGRATVLLDVRASTHGADSLEAAISAAASLVMAGSRRQDLVRLVTSDGRDSGFAAGHAHVEAIMEHLASLEATHDASYRRILDRAARSSTGGALVAVVGAAPTTDLERIARLRTRFGAVTIVQVDPASWDPTQASAPLWHEGVLRVGAERPFAAVWNQAVGRVQPTRPRMTRRLPARPQEDVAADRWGSRRAPQDRVRS
ncbi:MAG: DUF58 domain-containing protein [Acidimicrobiales bacterium]|nr:DUF58 domain-containing protein [Acidimicrobiales bacterium]